MITRILTGGAAISLSLPFVACGPAVPSCEDVACSDPEARIEFDGIIQDQAFAPASVAAPKESEGGAAR